MNLNLLAIGGPKSGRVIASEEADAYAVQVVVHGDKRQLVYLHRSVRWCPPQPERIIREYITPEGCWATTDWDMEVIAYHWFLLGDEDRLRYTRFLQV